VTAVQRLAAFAVAAAAAVGLGFGIGRAVGPFDQPEQPPAMHMEHTP
jgi:hypothetical protein